MTGRHVRDLTLNQRCWRLVPVVAGVDAALLLYLLLS